MKLVIALIVVHVYTDKLILYGILTTFVSLIFMIILQIYCHRNYSECTYSIHKYHNKELMKEMSQTAQKDHRFFREQPFPSVIF